MRQLVNLSKWRLYSLAVFSCQKRAYIIESNIQGQRIFGALTSIRNQCAETYAINERPFSNRLVVWNYRDSKLTRVIISTLLAKTSPEVNVSERP
jgi:hypothetical protein